MEIISRFFFFFFQAEDGIRDLTVTGVQTCALPISPPPSPDGGSRRARRASAACPRVLAPRRVRGRSSRRRARGHGRREIGRAAWRGRVEISVVAGSLKKKKKRRDRSRTVYIRYKRR